MLTALRSKTSKFVLKIVFALLIASFAVWGIGDIFRGGGRAVELIEIGPRVITEVEMRSEYDRQIMQLRQVYGSSIDAETARALGVVNRVVNDVVARGLFAVFTDRIGMRVGDEAVRQVIVTDPSFRSDLGQFDRSLFEAWLSRNRMSEEMLVARLREDIARGQLTTSLVAGVQAPQSLVGAVHDYRAEKRVAETLRVPGTDVAGIAAPDDAALEAYYQENIDRYQAPEFREVSVLRLSPEELAAEIRIDDAEIQASFEARKAEFDVAEKRHLEQIVFPDEAAARTAAEKLAAGTDAGADFATIAREATGGAPIDLGTVDKASLARSFPQLADAAFATPAGAVSAPTESLIGWHLVHVLAVEPGREATLAEHRDAVAHDLAVEQARDSIVSIANQLEDELAGGATLEEAAAKLGLPLSHAAAIDSAGLDPAGNPVEGIADEPGLPGLAFGIEAGQLSPLSDSVDGGYYVLRVDGITPAAARPFEEVRDQVTADWLKDAWAKAAEAKAAALVERLNGGESMATIAAELGQQVATSAPVERDGDGAGLSAAAVNRLFGLKQGEVAAVADGADQLILRLTEIRQPTDGGDPTATREVRESLRTAMASDIVNQFMGALQQDIAVSINADAIDRLF